MKRVGYDADSGKYYFRDSDGSLWEGAQGAEYSEMRKGMIFRFHFILCGVIDSMSVEDAPIALPEGDIDDLEVGPTRADGYAPLPSDGVSYSYTVTCGVRSKMSLDQAACTLCYFRQLVPDALSILPVDHRLPLARIPPGNPITLIPTEEPMHERHGAHNDRLRRHVLEYCQGTRVQARRSRSAQPRRTV